jgi:hypothetical protein
MRGVLRADSMVVCWVVCSAGTTETKLGRQKVALTVLPKVGTWAYWLVDRRAAATVST